LYVSLNQIVSAESGLAAFPGAGGHIVGSVGVSGAAGDEDEPLRLDGSAEEKSLL
jgi:uncharacterized protein GlcG (DUF336 family)